MSEGWRQDDRRRRCRQRWLGNRRMNATVAVAAVAVEATWSATASAFLPINNPAGIRSLERTGCVGRGRHFTQASPAVGGWRMWSGRATPGGATTSMMSAKPVDGCTAKVGGGGYYRPFASYAWDRLTSSGLVLVENDGDCERMVPSELRWNSVPAMGPGYPDGSQTSIEIRALSGTGEGSEEGPLGGIEEGDGSRRGHVVRLARYALLETLAPLSAPDPSEEEDGDADDGDWLAGGGNGGEALPGIQVLNLVIFPNVPRHDLPVFGADLVSLPGDKHLIAIDFQPVRPPAKVKVKVKVKEEIEGGEGADQAAEVTTVKCAFLKEEVQKYEPEPMAVAEEEEGDDGLNLSPEHRRRLEDLHSTYLPDMPWGGDIPPDAARFFSPFALWTRFGGGGASRSGTNGEVGNDGMDAKEKIGSTVFRAFRDYLDLYVDILLDAAAKNDAVVQDPSGLIEGETDYLEYRRANDPARPMLTRLYGEDFAEGLITKVLFPGSDSTREEKE